MNVESSDEYSGELCFFACILLIF